MSWLDFAKKINEIIDEIVNTQSNNINSASTILTNTITDNGLIHVFGTGHSGLVVAEAMPRTGSIIGFHPIIEPSLSYFMNVVGPMGHAQATFFERLEGFGKIILQNQIILNKDSIILVSHSGINSVVIDIAIEAKKMGLTVIGITSIKHGSICESRHSSGAKLPDVSDIILNTCVPYGDALLEINGIDDKVGPASSIFSGFLLQALICDVAEKLNERGHSLVIMPNPNTKCPDTEEKLSNFYKMYQRTIFRT